MPPRKRGRSKYGNQKCVIDGITFHSKGEGWRWLALKSDERAGRISNLKRQVPFDLQGMNGPVLTPTGRRMRYFADFTYTTAEGLDVIEDFKGCADKVYLIKKAIMAAQGIHITET